MKIAGVSDLHGYLPIYPSDWWEGIRDCEILFICGDISPLSIQGSIPLCEEWLLEEFRPWANDLPVEKVIFIGGNHDFYLERCKKRDNLFHWFPSQGKITYLYNNKIEYISSQDSKVYNIYGTPYCHKFGNWAFMREDETLKEKFAQIPENLDILITHDPPKLGTVGTILQPNRHNTGIDAGGQVLAEAVLEKKPKLVLSGHIHSGNHNVEEVEGIKLVNCSILDESYRLSYCPIIIEL